MLTTIWCIKSCLSSPAIKYEKAVRDTLGKYWNFALQHDDCSSPVFSKRMVGFAFKPDFGYCYLTAKTLRSQRNDLLFPQNPKKKPNCSLRDLNGVTLGGSAVFFKLRFGISQCYVPFEDPWLSVSILRWVWFFNQELKLPTKQITFCQELGM